MSYYTGRYPSTHGATWNRVPLSVGEVTMGEYLRAGGRKLVLAGKTHVMVDHDGLARLNLDGRSELGRLLRPGGFEAIARSACHHDPGPASGPTPYLHPPAHLLGHPRTHIVLSPQ